MIYAVMPILDWDNILDSVKAKTGKSDPLVSGDVASAIDSISGGYGDIPTYHYTECARVLEKIENFKSAHPNHLVFGAVSDIHVNNTNADTEAKTKASIKHASFALETVGAMGECDFIANLGDLCEEQHIWTNPGEDSADYDDYVAYIAKHGASGLVNAQFAINAMKPAFARLTRYSLVGNHDRTKDTQAQFDLIGSYNEFDDYGHTQIRGFGYKDFANKKVRVIVLNTIDYLNDIGGCALSYDQKDFLMRALDLSAKSDCAEWQILLLSHIPLDWNDGDYNYYADLQAILTAYENGTTASITVNLSYALNERNAVSTYATYSSGKLVYNYSGKNSAKIIANIHGHIHNNKVGKIKNTSIARISTGNANYANSADKYASYGDYVISASDFSALAKQFGTVKDTSATFYCIDLDAQVVYAYGYGADVDREIIYKASKKYSITYTPALTNITTSNNAKEVVEGGSFETTLILHSGYTIDTVKVTMGGVDITSSVYIDSSIMISSVTGDIVISATAKENYEPHWDIADRTAVTINAAASATKSISRNKYYVGASSTGAIYGGNTAYITNYSVSGNDVTFTSTSKDVGIGLPYHFEVGSTYRFEANCDVRARLRWCWLNSDGSYANQGGYGDAAVGTIWVDVPAPASADMWVMVILDTNTVNASIKYTNISLTKK